MNYTKDSQYYYIDGKKYIRATTVLSVLNKKGLNDWRANVGAEVADAWTETTRDIGLEVHRLINEIINGKSFSDTPAHILEWTQLDNPIKNGLRAYEQARLTLGFKPVLSELLLVSEKYDYAGTTDCLVKFGRYPWLLDWKVASRLWPETEYQLAAYYNAYREMTGKKLSGAMAIRLDRDTGRWTPPDRIIMYPDELEKKFELYKSLLAIWREENDIPIK